MIRIMIAEDHQSLIDGVTLMLKNDSDIEIIDTALDGEELLAKALEKLPDVILMDIRMPQKNGIEVTEILSKSAPSIKVLAFTMFDQQEAVNRMLKAGAKGYILKKSSLKIVREAIIKLANGDTYYDNNIEVKDLSSNNMEGGNLLSPRQTEILELIASGLTSREIADRLHIGVYTVDTHRKNMIRVLGLSGSNELIKYAIESKQDWNE